MDKKYERRIKYLILIVGLFIGELVALGLINTPFTHYYSDSEVNTLKNKMWYFSYSHQNNNSGLFIEPNIDQTFRATDSINFTSSNFKKSDLINPVNKSYFNSNMKTFFLDYLFEKQNQDGSFSNVAGLGTLFSTYQVIRTIDLLNSSYLDSDEAKPRINKISGFINACLNKYGLGYKSNPSINYSDIISTYSAIYLADRFNFKSVFQNENLTNYLDLLSLGRGYSLSIGAPKSSKATYYGIKAYFGLNESYSNTERNFQITFLYSLGNVDGGYSNIVGSSISDLQSTYYCISSLYRLGASPVFGNLTESLTLSYVKNCQKKDGGFANEPYINTSSAYDPGWAGMNTLYLLKKYGSLTNISISENELSYFNWLSKYQGLNGLFGETSLNSNYNGVLALYNYNSKTFSNYIKMKNIWDYTLNCYDPFEGGFGFQPNSTSSIYSTYLAIKMYDLFKPYMPEITLPNRTKIRDYLVSLQNPDGGFKVGHDIDYIISLFGTENNIFREVINTNISVVESTFWAISSLNRFKAMNYINTSSLTNWILSCQSADGGFGFISGFHSDLISTYYGIQVLKLLNKEPMSKMAIVGFIKKAQRKDGLFNLMPAISILFNLPSPFLGVYLSSISLYSYHTQPERMIPIIKWFSDSISSKTGGVADYPWFGGDLRNNPYAILIIDDYRYDHSFDPAAWNQLIIYIMIGEVLFFFGILFLNLLSYINYQITKKVKTQFGIGEKLNIKYLKRFKAINCENLSIYVGKKVIVDTFSLKLEHGKILGVLGESGAGKSTFVKTLLGMRKYKGICEIYGMDSKKNKRKIRPIYGYVPQDLGKIYPDFTVLENLMYFGKQYNLTEKEIQSKAKRLLRSLEIEEKMNELVKNLSGGEKRRVSIAIALVHNPIFCILDEPTSGLDPVIREELWLALTKINEKFNTTLIVITHYPEEGKFCHKIIIFGRNRGMIDSGSPNDLLTQLPGGGRTVDLYFYDVQENAIERLESIEGIEKALENKVGTDFAILSDLNLESLRENIEEEFGTHSILGLKQTDTKMEEYFRYRAMEIPQIE
ncbi:MAG: ATP-binding cassette domain-containing protein [Candidatus Lokiarchaeota archaeon]